MKKTVDISDDLLARAELVAGEEHTTLGALVEEGLGLVLVKRAQLRAKGLPPLVTFNGDGLTEAFQHWTWENVREEVYEGRGGVEGFMRS